MTDNILILRERTEALMSSVLTKSKNSGYNCPFCGSGTGNNGKGTGMVYTASRKQFYCNTCNKPYDIVDIIKQKYGINTGEAVRKGFELLNLPFTGFGSAKATPPPPKPKPQINYSKFYETCVSVSNTDYLRKRGISDTTATGAGVVYSPQCHGVVFKYDLHNWWIRYTTDDDTEKRYYRNNGIIGRLSDGQKNCNKLWNIGSTMPLFNMQAAENTQYLIIAEGQINCLSVIEAGEPNCIALGSKNNVKKFYEALDTGKFDRIHTFYIALDTDADTVAQAMIERIKSRIPEAIAKNITPYIEGNDTSDHDINYLLVQKGKEELNRILTKAITAANLQKEDKQKAEAIAKVKAKCIDTFLQGYWNKVHDEQEKPIRTGFTGLDKMIGGGLYDGRLYILGAMSGTGKTALATQIAENIASQGRDVYYFSLEMTQEELTNRLLSKHIAQRLHDLEYKSREEDYNRYATDSNHIRQYADRTQEQQERIEQAFMDIGATQAYKHLYIHANIMNMTVESMLQAVEDHYKATDTYPVVIVDYLQIIRPDKEAKNTKENVDAIVTGLKSMTIKGMPVIVISSFNRESYNKPITLNAFKESGNIEYTADLVLGLQFTGMSSIEATSAEDFKRKCKEVTDKGRSQKFARGVEIVLLKSRISDTYVNPVKMTFYGRYSYFVEGERNRT